jgi:hypothetical protein
VPSKSVTIPGQHMSACCTTPVPIHFPTAPTTAPTVLSPASTNPTTHLPLILPFLQLTMPLLHLTLQTLLLNLPTLQLTLPPLVLTLSSYFSPCHRYYTPCHCPCPYPYLRKRRLVLHHRMHAGELRSNCRRHINGTVPLHLVSRKGGGI